MGKRLDKVKNFLGELGKIVMPEVVRDYLKARAMDKFEILMRGFGGVLTVWTISFFGGLVALATSGSPQWGYVIAAGLGATGDWLTSVYRILFGASKNGNGNGEKTTTT